MPRRSIKPTPSLRGSTGLYRTAHGSHARRATRSTPHRLGMFGRGRSRPSSVQPVDSGARRGEAMPRVGSDAIVAWINRAVQDRPHGSHARPANQRYRDQRRERGSALVRTPSQVFRAFTPTSSRRMAATSPVGARPCLARGQSTDNDQPGCTGRPHGPSHQKCLRTKCV